MVCTERCKSCAYSMRLPFMENGKRTLACDYMDRAGGSRGCIAGDSCERYEQRRPEPSEPDNTRARLMYEAGLTDAEMARALGASIEMIRRWRMARWLPANRKGGAVW